MMLCNVCLAVGARFDELFVGRLLDASDGVISTPFDGIEEEYETRPIIFYCWLTFLGISPPRMESSIILISPV
jgi:hypothetical protein